MAPEYQCPQCHSPRVKIRYPDIECLACGWSAPLIDFPISYNCHRFSCLEYGQPEPGPSEPSGYNIEELCERVLALEEGVQLLEKSRLEVHRRYDKPKPAEGVKL